jgi:hypothetical protein
MKDYDSKKGCFANDDDDDDDGGGGDDDDDHGCIALCSPTTR